MPKTVCCTNVYFPDRATIQQDSSTDGNPAEDFSGSALATSVPGRLVNVSGDETYRGRQLEAHISHVYECRYRSGVLPTMRLLMVGGIHGGKYLNIEHVKVVREQGKIPMLFLYCREKVVV